MWLRGILSDGPVPSADLETMAKAEGYSQDQLRGARDRLGVKPDKVGRKWMVSI